MKSCVFTVSARSSSLNDPILEALSSFVSVRLALLMLIVATGVVGGVLGQIAAIRVLLCACIATNCVLLCACIAANCALVSSFICLSNSMIQVGACSLLFDGLVDI